MYLRGSKWNMAKRSRRPSNPWRVLFLSMLVVGAIYLNRVVIPKAPALFVPTPTPTRSPESYINEADKFVKDGKLLQAIDAYQQAIQVAPTNKAIYVALARVQIFAGQYDKALENAERSLVGNDQFAAGLAIRAWALNFQQKYTDAEIEISRALELDPNKALAHAYAAEIYMNRNEYGDLDRAKEESKTAVSLAPNSMEALRARAYVLYQTGNYKEALDLYQAAIAINKYIPDLYLWEGYTYQSLEESDPEATDKAIKAFLQAKALNPKDPQPDVELSKTYLKVGQYEKAIQYAENAIKADPTNPYRYGNLGVIYYRKEDYNKAIDALTLAIRGGTSPDGVAVKGHPLDDDWMAMYYWFYGFALAKVEPNRCSEAVPIFQALLVTMPDNDLATENAQAGLELCQSPGGNTKPEPTATEKPNGS